MKFNCFALAAFGLEGIVARELKRMGFDAKGEIGGARFQANYEEILSANIRLRCADRVLLILKEQKALSFDEIFDIVSTIDWKNIIPKNAKINIKAKCVRSQIMSPRDCQSITKKAIIKNLQKAYNSNNILENGIDFNIDLALVNDIFRISLNTSGEALNKRGYRTFNVEAPIRETLAAAMLEISPWKKIQHLYDPCCGSGTFLIEAAYMALNKAPGLDRQFDIEKWGVISKDKIKEIRQELLNEYKPEREIYISGSDINSEVIKVAKKHIIQAGLENRINISNIDLKNLNLESNTGCFIVNPPYGERLSEKNEVIKLYNELGRLFLRHKGWSMTVISNDINFEKHFGRKADRKRKVFNGRFECNIYIYYSIQNNRH